MHKIIHLNCLRVTAVQAIQKKLYSTKISTKIVQQIPQKNFSEKNGSKEPIMLVYAETVRPEILEKIARQSLLNGKTIILPTTTNEPHSKGRAKTVKTPELPWQCTPASIDFSKLINHYLMLSKIRLTTLVVITSMAGYAMAPAPFEFSTFALCTIGTGLCSAAANAINQYHEVPFDAQMSRTKNRVLVRGLVTPLHAIGFASVSSLAGISFLYFGVNGFTAALGAANLLLYTSIYTPMKRFSILNTWIGSFVGAIPPLMGWVGCTGTIDAGGWILAGLLYAWQFPHFNALSWNLRPDYSRAGYRMMAVTDPELCRRTALRYTVALAALSLSAPYFDVTNVWFSLATLPLNGYFAYLAYKFYKHSDSGTSRKLFRFSLVHLPALMILFLVCKKRWIFTEETVDATGTLKLATPVIAKESENSSRKTTTTT